MLYVLLHGYLESLKIWGELVSKLSEKYRVIIIDLPSHGESSLPMRPNIIEYMSEAVNAVIEYLKISKLILIGHSMGGYVALEYLKQNPEKILGLSLFHSIASHDTDMKKKNREREIELIKDGKKELLINSSITNAFANENVLKLQEEINYAKIIALNTSEKGIIVALEGMGCRKDNLPLLKKLTIPVLFVVGMKDNNILPAKIISESKLVKNNTILKLEKSGHMGFIEEFEKTLNGIDNFITKCN